MNFWTSPWLTLWRQRRLLVELTRREILLSTRGTWLGWLWLVLGPLALLAVYTLVFALILPPTGDDKTWGATGLRIFAALVPFTMFTDILARSPQLLVANASYVKKTLFPVELLPVARCLTSAFFSLISLGLLIVFELVIARQIHMQWLLIPLLYLPLLLLCLGTGWFLAALGVYLRDTVQLSALLASLLLFLTPVFYPLTAVPARWQFAFQANPLTAIVESFRMVMVVGSWPHWASWSLCLLICTLICHLGFACFNWIRRGFADVI